MKARTAQANHIRGLLSEYGIVLAQEINYITRGIPAILEGSENALPVTPHSNDYPPAVAIRPTVSSDRNKIPNSSE